MESKARRWLPAGLFDYSVKLAIKYALPLLAVHCAACPHSLAFQCENNPHARARSRACRAWRPASLRRRERLRENEKAQPGHGKAPRQPWPRMPRSGCRMRRVDHADPKKATWASPTREWSKGPCSSRHAPALRCAAYWKMAAFSECVEGTRRRDAAGRFARFCASSQKAAGLSATTRPGLPGFSACRDPSPFAPARLGAFQLMPCS